MDMLVNLQHLPECESPNGIQIIRVLPPDRHRVLAWVRDLFGESWESECAVALSAQPNTCFIARKDGVCIGFACYDATARGFFGPIGVDESTRGAGVGRALLILCLQAMCEAGYGYAVIGWCDEAAGFYQRAAGAIPIPDSAPEQSVYGRLSRF